MNFNAPHRLKTRQATIIAALIVTTVTFIVFSPALKNGFIGWDDGAYVLESPFITPLTPATIGEMFSRFYFYSYTPLAHLSHAIDYRLWELDVRGHHLSSIVIHCGNAFLLLLIALAISRRLRGTGTGTGADSYGVYAGAVVAALLFALHPMRVESVSTVSSRKDVLSAFLGLASVLVYLSHASRRGGPGARIRYSLSLVLFAAAFLSKASVMTLPGVLLLLDVLLEGLEGGWSWFWLRLKEKIPFVVLAVGGAAAAYFASTVEGMDQVMRAQSHINPVEMGFYNIGFYIGRTVWPMNFAAIYDHPLGVMSTISLLIGPLATVACIVLWAKGTRLPLIAWVCYVLLILPVSGFIITSIQPTANRYAYIATVPFALLGGSIITALMGDPRIRDRRWARRGVMAVISCLLIVLAGLTVQDIPRWRDGTTVWTRAMEVSPLHPLTFASMGNALQDKEDYKGAIPYYVRALELAPDHPATLIALGAAFLGAGDTTNAEKVLTSVIALAPNESAAYGNLGNVRLRERRLDEALALFNKANELTPSSYTFMYNIGQVYMLQGRSAESVAMFRRALKLNPNLREGYFMLGLVLSKQISDEAEALAALRRAATLGHVEAQKFLLSRGETW